MKRVVAVMLGCSVFLCAWVSGEIIETPHFSEITQYVTPKTVVVLDVDDTLLVPVQTLGSDVWFLSRVKMHEKAGDALSIAFAKALAEWQAIRHLTKMKIVEEGTDKVIANLQRQNHVVMGLTTQGLALATRTIEQLRAVGIDLTKTTPSKEDCYFHNVTQGVLFRNGLLFTAGSAKGVALMRLFDTINYHPEHIIFINDKATHLKDVEETVVARGIRFTGLRYSHEDKRVASFRLEIADVQWNASSFAHILSDEEAEARLSP